MKAAQAKGLIATTIRDAGRTQIAAGSRTVLGVGPGNKKNYFLIDRFQLKYTLNLIKYHY